MSEESFSIKMPDPIKGKDLHGCCSDKEDEVALLPVLRRYENGEVIVKWKCSRCGEEI